jgi:5-methylcytosine-specific restriction endonuclease McrA
MIMPKGITKNGLWRGLESLDNWVQRMESQGPIFCACGCGKQIKIQKSHRQCGIPRFVLGHHSRVEHGRYLGVDKWVEENQGNHLCACGCGAAIFITSQHHATGIPRYLLSHHPRHDLGHGPQHPKYIQNRTQVKSRNGQYFTPWTMKMIHRCCNGRCVRCGRDQKLEYDHILPIASGGTGHYSNGQLLCKECHRLKTQIDILRNCLFRKSIEAIEKIKIILREIEVSGGWTCRS